jgi:NAD(P)-dependent dehydrogenase (short-subunit alcohol dehydrogenase family)
MESLFSVKDKRIVITGGAGGLCAAMARCLAEAGAWVCVVDYDGARAKTVCQEIVEAGGHAFPVESNVLDKARIEEAAALAIEKMGHVDILLNGAGGNKKEATTGPDMSFFDIPADAIRWVFDLNLLGTVMPSQVFGRHMAERGQGNILNVSSMNAFTPLTKIAAYSAAKAAVSNFTQWLAVHMCQNYSTDIRVNALAPGFFLTQQNRFLLTDEATGNLTPRGQQIIDHTPMGRFGAPEDLLGATLWLLSDASKFVTGTCVAVDGGFSAYSGV